MLISYRCPHCGSDVIVETNHYQHYSQTEERWTVVCNLCHWQTVVAVEIPAKPKHWFEQKYPHLERPSLN